MSKKFRLTLARIPPAGAVTQNKTKRQPPRPSGTPPWQERSWNQHKKRLRRTGATPPAPLIFIIHSSPHHLKPVGGVRARAVGCLTEQGIVCFPAVCRTKRGRVPEPQGREALRGPRRSSGRPGPDPAGRRCHAEKDEETTTPPFGHPSLAGGEFSTKGQPRGTPPAPLRNASGKKKNYFFN